MRKPALDTSHAAVVIVVPAGKTVPFVVPITRVRYGLELLPWVGERRTTVFLRDGLVLLVVTLTNEGECLMECLPCLGRCWILLKDGREVCMCADP